MLNKCKCAQTLVTFSQCGERGVESTHIIIVSFMTGLFIPDLRYLLEIFLVLSISIF